MLVHCPPLERAKAKPRSKLVSGIAVTDLSTTEATVFKEIAEPPCRIAELERPNTGFAGWRGNAFLDPCFHATRKAWPVEAQLSPGIDLSYDGQMSHAEAERVVAAFRTGDLTYAEIVKDALSDYAGITLETRSGLITVIVSEECFPKAVEIGTPGYLSELLVPA